MKIIEKISIEQKDKLHALQAILDHHKRALKEVDYIDDEEEFFKRMNHFWKFISSYEDEEIFTYFEHSGYYQKNRHFFSSMQSYYIRIVETADALKIITKPAAKNQKSSDLFGRQIAKESYLQTQKELSMIDWQGKNKVVIVGSGPLPVTILYLHDNTTVERIVGLDNNQEAIYIAGETIKSLYNTSRIQLPRYNCLDYSYGDADLIYVGNFVSPKTKILNRIAATVRSGVQILVQTPVSFAKMLYDGAFGGLNPRLTITQEGAVNKYFLSKTIVMQKLDI